MDVVMDMLVPGGSANRPSDVSHRILFCRECGFWEAAEVFTSGKKTVARSALSHNVWGRIPSPITCKQ